MEVIVGASLVVETVVVGNAVAALLDVTKEDVGEAEVIWAVVRASIVAAVEVLSDAKAPADASTVVVGEAVLVVDEDSVVISTKVFVDAVDVELSDDVATMVAGEDVLLWIVSESADMFATIVVAVLFASSDAIVRWVVVPINKKKCTQKLS